MIVYMGGQARMKWLREITSFRSVTQADGGSNVLVGWICANAGATSILCIISVPAHYMVMYRGRQARCSGQGNTHPFSRKLRQTVDQCVNICVNDGVRGIFS